jgi:hypothetical protein
MLANGKDQTQSHSKANKPNPNATRRRPNPPKTKASMPNSSEVPRGEISAIASFEKIKP